jgi:beta-barrel assembly-enhancing protease
MTQFGYGSNQFGNSGGGGVLRLLLAIGVALFGIIGYLSRTSINPTTGEKQHVGNITPEQETALGLQSAPQMIGQMGGEVAASDPETQEVQRIGAYVHDHSTAAKSPYTYQYHLLADPQTINAFALPGGQVFITKALYDRLDDEAELAGVLGHETGHVVERHSAQQMAKGQLGQSLVTATGIAASRNGSGIAASMIAGLVNNTIMLRFSREDESQADACGLRFMTEAGFDPRAMIDVMKILQSVTAQTGREPEFMVTHPYPEHRIEAIQQWLADHPEAAQQMSRGNALPKD